MPFRLPSAPFRFTPFSFLHASLHGMGGLEIHDIVIGSSIFIMNRLLDLFGIDVAITLLNQDVSLAANARG